MARRAKASGIDPLANAPDNESPSAADSASLLGLPSGSIARTAASQAAELMRQAILEGRLLPGAPLREERLAAELGISRTPVRQALLILELEGIVEAFPNRGAFVRQYDLDEILDLYELKSAVDAHATARAAARMSQEALDQLKTSCERYAALVDSHDIRGIALEDQYFHRTIREAAESPAITRVLELIGRAPVMYRTSYWAAHAEVALHYHEGIEQALRTRDSARAASLMREHWLEAANTLREILSPDNVPEPADLSYPHPV